MRHFRSTRDANKRGMLMIAYRALSDAMVRRRQWGELEVCCIQLVNSRYESYIIAIDLHIVVGQTSNESIPSIPCDQFVGSRGESIFVKPMPFSTIVHIDSSIFRYDNFHCER